MDMNSVLSELREEGNISNIKKYERMLQKEIKENPSNIRAVCLLAMVKCELLKSTSTSLKYLHSAYNHFKDSLDDSEFCMLVTNLAYFYIEECANKEKTARALLQEAITRNSPYAETYYALALEYYKEGQFEQALPLFQKATNLSSLFRHRYNYAICLSQCNQERECIEILKTLSNDYKTHEYSAKAYYSLGVLYVFLAEEQKAKEIALHLLNIDYFKFDIEHYMLADFMFSVGEYQHCFELYDKEQQLWETADWLSLYFYSQKKMNRTEDASKKLYQVIDAISEKIKDCRLEDFDDKKDFDEYIHSENKRMEDVKTAYQDIFYADVTPVARLQTDLIYGCYYIDCQRHPFDDIQNTTV